MIFMKYHENALGNVQETCEVYDNGRNTVLGVFSGGETAAARHGWASGTHGWPNYPPPPG